METDSLKRSLSSPSFSGRRNQNFGAGLLARSSVSELAAWYQEIFGCGNHCSAQEAPKNDSPQMSRSKSTESLAFHLTNPCEITGRNFVGGHFISRSAAALPTLVEFLAESPAPDPQGKSPTEFSKMAAIRHPDSKFQLPQENSMSSFSSQHNKKKEQGGHTVCLQENESVQKEAKFTRRSKAAPSASVTRIVENYESLLGVFSSSDDRSHIPRQGRGPASSPSAQEQLVPRLSPAAAAVDHARTPTEPAVGKCTSCAKPVHPMECLAMQKIPLHQSCFCCTYCGKELSLLNYAVSRGAFFCQAHSQLLAKGGSQERRSSTKQKSQPLQVAALPSPGLEPKTRNNPTGKILTRETMPPRLCRSRPDDGLRSAKQTRPSASPNKLRIRWPPSKEAAAPEEAGRKVSKLGTNTKLPRDGALFGHSSGFAHEALRNMLIVEASHTEKKQRLFPKVAVPKTKDCISSWFKPQGGNEDWEVLEEKVLSMDRKIPGSHARKSPAGISEKAETCQLANDTLQRKESISAASPLTSVSAQPSGDGLSPFCLKALQTARAAHSAGRAILLPRGSNLANVPLQGYGLRGRSPGKEASAEGHGKGTPQDTQPLLKARIKLPVLTRLDNRSVPKASSMPRVFYEPKQSGHVGPKWRPEMENRKPFQTQSAASVCPTEQKGEESRDTKGHPNWISDSDPDAPEMCNAPSQAKKGFQVGRDKSPGSPASLQESGKPPCPETLSEEAEKENKMNPEGKPEHSGASQDTKPEAVPSIAEAVAEVEDGGSAFCSRAGDSENGNVLSSHDPQNAPQLGHLTPSASESLGAVTAPIKNEEQAGSENACHLPSQRDPVEGTSVQASEGNKTAVFSSHEAAKGTENQPRGDMNVPSQNQDGTTLQGVLGDSVKKTPLEKGKSPSAGVLASKNPKKEPSGTTNVSQKQSALVTLFGYSSDKGKNKKEEPRKTTTKSLMVEGKDEKQLQAESSSSPPSTEENPQVVIQPRNPETDLGANDQNCSKQEQRAISPPVVQREVCSTKTLPAFWDPDVSSSAVVLSGSMDVDIPRPTALKKETIPQHDAESSPLVRFQNPFASTENMLPSCVRQSTANIVPDRDLYDKELSSLAPLENQDLELKAGNDSFSGAPRADDGHLIVKALLVSKNRSVDTQERASRFNPDLDLGGSQMEDQPERALSSSDGNLGQRNGSHQSLECGPPAAIESVNEKNIPGTGIAGGFQPSDQQTCFHVSAEDSVGVGPHNKQAAPDSYPSHRDDFPLLLPPLQCVPELLQDITQAKAAGRVTAAERCPEDQGAAEETHEYHEGLLAPDRSASPTVIGDVI